MSKNAKKWSVLLLTLMTSVTFAWSQLNVDPAECYYAVFAQKQGFLPLFSFNKNF